MVAAPATVGATPPAGVSSTGQSVSIVAPAPRGLKKAKLVIKGHNFSKVKVKVGKKVKVVNRDSVDHTVTSNTGAWPEVFVPAGQKRKFRAPATTGKYKFHCRLHPGMKGKLKVKG